jgi:hypothetical protein
MLSYLVFAVSKFLIRNDFTLSLRLQKAEIFFLFIAGFGTKNLMFIALPILSTLEYFHFFEQFCLAVPSEKWDGNDITEEFED